MAHATKIRNNIYTS